MRVRSTGPVHAVWPHTRGLLRVASSYRRPLYARLVLSLGTALAALFLFAGFVVFKYRDVLKVTGFSTEYRAGAFFVSRILAGGPSDGRLKVGDRLLAIDGDPRAERVGPAFRIRQLPGGSSYELLVGRGQERLAVRLRLENAPRPPGDAPYYLSILAVGLAFVVTGLVIGAARPEEGIARVGTAALMLSALTILRSGVAGFVNLLQGAETILSPWVPVMSPLHMAAAFAFFVGFPAGVTVGRFGSSLRWALYALSTMEWIAQEIRARCLAQAGLPFLDFFGHLFPMAAAIAKTFNAFSIVAFSACIFAVARNYRNVREADAIRRMRWITFGSIAGMSPWLLFLIATSAAPGVDWGWLNRVANVALILVPVTTGYAIVKHRLFDIRVVLRSGLRYLLARRFLTAALAAPIVGLTITIYLSRHKTLGEIVFGNTVYFYVFGLSAISLAFRKRLLLGLDRMFFREAYDREQLLLNLAGEVPKLGSLSEVSRVVHRELAAALHPKSLHVFHREKGSAPVLVFSFSSHGSQPSIDIPDDSELLRLVAATGKADCLDYPLAPGNPLPEAERAWLSQLGVNLIVPLTAGEGNLLGLILLGEKQSEEPYGASDRTLLQAIAAQMAIVHERSALMERVDKDRRYAREVLSRLTDPSSYVKECPRCNTCYDGTDSQCEEDGAELFVSLPVPRALEGRYELRRLLGRGGMGAVYEAHDQRLNRPVAVKILMGSLFDNELALRRFEREAQTSARLNHPNIIAVYDFGTLKGGGAFLVMELMPGRTLRDELRSKRRLSPPASVPLFAQILQGAKSAHDSGVVHRDLKPENVLIGRGTGSTASAPAGFPVVKILDFGLAKTTLLDFSKPDTLTLPGAVLGSLGYMSPEQFSGAAIDLRTDVFSLGILVAETVTGRAPFQGSTFREVMLATLTHSWHLIGNEPGHKRLDAVLQTCLTKSPSDRYASVEALERELLPALLNCPPLPVGWSAAGSEEVKTHEMSPGRPESG